MKFCIDCIHYQEETQYCLATAYVDMVTGSAEHRSAATERVLDETGCGKAARLFKPIRQSRYTEDELDDLSKIPFGK